MITTLGKVKVGDKVRPTCNSFTAFVQEINKAKCQVKLLFDDSSSGWYGFSMEVELLESTVVPTQSSVRVRFCDVNIGETFTDNGKEWRKKDFETASRTAKYVPDHKVSVERSLTFKELDIGDRFECNGQMYVKISGFSQAIVVDEDSVDFGMITPFSSTQKINLIKQKGKSVKFLDNDAILQEIMR